MGGTTLMTLRLTQGVTRTFEFCCGALILALFSYFLATMGDHKLHIPIWIRAVEGIAGAATLYTLLTLFLLCCVAGHPVLSSWFMLLDILFVGAFIYLASANRDGAGSCKGIINTPYGRGNSSTTAVGNGGTITLPTLHRACKMQTACFVVAIVGIFLFILSALFELALIRYRRKARRYSFAPSINGYDTSGGYGRTKPPFLSRFTNKKRRNRPTTTDLSENPNALPKHTNPDALHRDSYETEQTRVNTSHGYGGHGGDDALPSSQPPMSSYGNYNYKPAAAARAPDPSPGAYTHHTEFANTGTRTGTGTGATNSPTHFSAGNYRYDDGVYDRT